MKKTAVLFVILLLSSVLFIPRSTAIYDVKGYYNITWGDENGDALTDVVQKIIFSKNTTVETISVQVGLVETGKYPDLTVGFGLYNNRTQYPFTDVAIREVVITKAKNVILDIHKKLSAGTYCLYFHVDRSEVLKFIAAYSATGIKIQWFWKIPYTGNNINGDVILSGLDVTYNWPPFNIIPPSYDYSVKTDTLFNDVFAYIYIKSDSSGALGLLHESNEQPTAYLFIAAAAVVMTLLFLRKNGETKRRSKK